MTPILSPISAPTSSSADASTALPLGAKPGNAGSCAGRWAAFFLLWLAVLPQAAFGALEWKKTTIDYQAKPEDESVTALFHFANTGSAPLNILSTKTSCGCTVAQLDKQVYAPGELGTIKVVFTFEGRSGHQTKGIQVITDDPANPIVLLTLNVEIPAFVSVEPQLLFWTRGETPVAKSAIITVLGPVQVFILKDECSNPSFDYTFTKMEDGKRYRVSVTPKDTTNTMEGKLTLTTSLGEQNPRKVFVALQVY